MHYRSGASWTHAGIMKLFKPPRPTLERAAAKPLRDAEAVQKKLEDFRKKYSSPGR